MYAQVIKITIAEELSICAHFYFLSAYGIKTFARSILTVWNTHAHVDKYIAQAHIEE